ncbi:hypothetical protein jhhlp_000945 [Lomentospora prolificans]|uniref:Anaphase-promoting complex subunit 11 RING-H2 finger domain-containing protein n=1 Tax=Lomentospora prolificans TaxID=41688 RepID=A0A2N3NJX7_9PEZI|nr:hypothetical protein jhhlp_000945 [Lomentospora prolificans]
MKVKITQWNTVATWRWDLPEDDVCGICQVHFDGTCPTCKYPGDDCSIRLSLTRRASSTVFWNGSSRNPPRASVPCVASVCLTPELAHPVSFWWLTFTGFEWHDPANETTSEIEE